MFRKSITLLTMLVASAHVRAGDIEQSALDSATKELKTAVARGRMVGGAHMVFHNGKVVHFVVAGAKDIKTKAKLRRDSIMRIYSMTKPITSVAAMVLWEKGKFKLDDPVSKYIPAFAHTKVINFKDGKAQIVAARRQITVRDLLRHTSGYSYGGGKVQPYYQKLGVRYHTRGMFPPRMTIEQGANALARVPALHQPGAKFTYGLNVDILGRLIEIWSEKPLDQTFATAIFKPLEMVDTGFSVPASKRDRFTSCHANQGRKTIVVDPADSSPYLTGFKFLSGGGGLVSTMRDYGHFCQMLVSHGKFKSHQILKPTTLRLMFTDQLAKEGRSGAFQFGLGFAIRRVTISGGKKMTSYHWGGYANTKFEVVPEIGMYQVFMRQLIPSTHSVSKKLFAIVNRGTEK